MDLSRLTDKDEMSAYEYCKQLIVESAESDKYYDSSDFFVSMLSSKISYQRTGGFGLICCQSRWDKSGKIKRVLDKMIPLLNDSKPTAVRQCLNFLHSVFLQVLLKYNKSNLYGWLRE